MDQLIELYPSHRTHQSVRGIYLNEPILDRPFVYANFLSSLDGRIAVGKGRNSLLPEELPNQNDFRLFLELQAQADCIITHGAYLRARANKTLGDVLHLNKKHQDLLTWRLQNQLAEDFKVAICSNSLDFPEPFDLKKEQVLIATSQASSPAKRQYWQDLGYKLAICGTHWVEGDVLCDTLEEQQAQRIFLCSGPKILASMLAKRRLNQMYLTFSHQMIGQESFHSLIEGEASGDLSHCSFHQMRLIYDQSPELKHKQWYARFDVRYSE